MSIKYKTLALIILTPILGIVLFNIGQSFYGGDLHQYRALYEMLAEISLNKSVEASMHLISSSDKAYIFISWISSNLGIPRGVFVFLSNLLLLSGVLIFLYKKELSALYLFLIIPNLYFLVLISSAERLKFAYIFLIFALVVKGSIKKIIFTLAAVLSHISIVIQILPIILFSFSRKISILNMFKVLIIILVLCFAIINLNPEKFKAYFGFYWKDALFLALVTFVGYFEQFKDKKSEYLIFTLPLVVVSLFIFPSRITMFFVISYLYFSLVNSCKSYFVPISISIYFVAMGVAYLINVLYYGHGFPIIPNFLRVIIG